MEKKWKVFLLIQIILISTITGIVLSWFIVEIDTSYNPYSEYASSVIDERGKLTSFAFVKTIQASEINNLFPEIDENQGNITDLPKYDIKIYRINYTSVFLYEIVTLSGLIIVPQKSGKLTHLQYHHGTMFPYPHVEGEGSLDAPSLYNGEGPDEEYKHYETRLFGNYLGSYGYLVSLPDYLGHGASNQYEHPYSVNDRLAEQCIDMIFATKEFCSTFSIELDEKLYLSGWSEGGAASLATQKLIESEYTENITITANAPLAGFFNIEFYTKLFVNIAPFIPIDIGDAIDNLLWALYSINKYTDDKPLNSADIFKFEVNNQMDVLKNRPTSTPLEALRYFISDKNKLMSKFAQNDLSYGWTPIAPVYVHQGTKDTEVPYPFNAGTTVNNLNKQGGNVTLVKYIGHNHWSLDKLYLLNMIEEFKK